MKYHADEERYNRMKYHRCGKSGLKPEQIRENVKIVEKTEFSEEELRRIDELSKAVTK